jgi:small-conductance mechanosensitive channel
LIEIKDLGAGSSHLQRMNPLPPFRERTAAQLREQAEAFRNEARSASEAERPQLLSLASRYEELARLKEAEGDT